MTKAEYFTQQVVGKPTISATGVPTHKRNAGVTGIGARPKRHKSIQIIQFAKAHFC